MREKEWNIKINEKEEYNIKIELPAMFEKISLKINGENILINKKIKCIQVYLTGAIVPIKIEDKTIVILIHNKEIDLAIDGYFIKTKRKCYFDTDKKDYIGYYYASFLSIMSFLAVPNLASFILLIIAIICHLRTLSNLYLTKKEKTIRYGIIAFLNWTIIIILAILYNDVVFEFNMIV